MALKFFVAPKSNGRASNGQTPKTVKGTLEVNDNGRIMFQDRFLKEIGFDAKTMKMAFCFDDEGAQEAAIIVLTDEVSAAGVEGFVLKPKSITSSKLRDQFYALWSPSKVELDTYARDEEGITLRDEQGNPIVSGSESRYNRLMFRIKENIDIEGLVGYKLEFIGEREPVGERIYDFSPGKRK